MNLIKRVEDHLRGTLIDLGEAPSRKTLAAFLSTRGASHTPHVGDRSLLEHLEGTESILRAWKVPAFCQRAGLFHSVYSTPMFKTALVDSSERGIVRRQIGIQAERLIFTFSRLDRAQLLRSLPEFLKPPFPPTGRAVPSINGAVVQHTQKEVLALLAILLANTIDQTSKPGGEGECGRWLATWSVVQGMIVESLGASSVPWPLFSTPISEEEEEILISTYEDGIQAWNRGNSDCLVMFESCVSLCPWLAEPHVWLSALWYTRDSEKASYHASEAARLLKSNGFYWDNRLTGPELRSLMPLLCDLEQGGEQGSKIERVLELAYRLNPALVRETKFPAVIFPDILSCRGTQRFAKYLASTVMGKNTEVYPGLGSQAIYTPSEIPLARDLEGSYEAIRSEVLDLSQDLFARESENIKRTGSWDVLFFCERGRLHLSNCRRCPTIAEIMLRHATVRSAPGLVYVSKLRAGTHITSHSGPTNVRLRCHLGVDVPTGDCGLRVGEQVLRWTNGRCLVFNDALPHEAWNKTAKDRTVLIMDLWHPDLDSTELALLKAFDRRVLMQANGLDRYWKANARSVEKRRNGYD